jgi:uncharacterized membrane protein
MKFADIQRLHEAGLITDDQRTRIVERFGLRENSNRFLVILSVVGALLVSLGLILLVASNWDGIPRLAKLAAGVAFLVGAHGAGAWLRGSEDRWPRVGEALHFAGALLFLGNIALVGQIYHLGSRTPDAWLLWWIGIAGLPWVLRSRPLHALSLCAFGIWFATECWADRGWLHSGPGVQPILLVVLLGLTWYGLGGWLHRTRWSLFAADTEKAGLTLALLFSVPLTFSLIQDEMYGANETGSLIPIGLMAGLATAALVAGLRRNERLAPPWRIAWGGTLGALVLFLITIPLLGPAGLGTFSQGEGDQLLAATASCLLFAFALVQVRIGVLTGSEWMVNHGILLLAAVLVSTYLGLIGSMANTGTLFVLSGVLLLGLGGFLERRRRTLLHLIRLNPLSHPAP